MKMKHVFDVGTRTHRWTFGHGLKDVVFAIPESDHPTFESAARHGYKQKIADAGAIVRDTTTGKSATDSEKRAAMQTICDRILIDELWNAERSGERKQKVAPINVEALVAAIVAIRNRPAAAALAFVGSKPENVRFALAMSDEFRLQYSLECVKAAGAAPKLDVELAAEIDAI
jgi:hypothetical protein